MLEQILSPGNLNAAYRQVGSNGGSPGMDKMDCDRLPEYLREHGEQLTGSIRRRTYHPNPVRRAGIPKDNGKKRRLGIPLIHKYLNAGVMANGKHEETREGTPQGDPLSPLLANILLNGLDKELERRGHPFVRHADDGLIFCKGRRAAGRVKEGITKFMESTPGLRVNREKTGSTHVGRLKFLGCGFHIRDGKCRLRLHQETEAKMRRRLKAVTSRNNGMGHAKRKAALKEYLRGGRNTTSRQIWAARSKGQTGGYAAESACAYGKHGNVRGRGCGT